MTDDELAKLQFATQTAESYLAASLAYHGKTCFDCIGGEVGPAYSSYQMNQLPPPRLLVVAKSR